jgi:hypothetical protein
VDTVAASTAAITEDDIEAYRQDGVVCIRRLYDAVWVERLRNAVDRHPVDCGLRPGDRPECDLFPLVWSTTGDRRA